MTTPPPAPTPRPGQGLDGDTSAVLSHAAFYLHRVLVTRSIGLSGAGGSDGLRPGPGALRDVVISAAARDGILDAVQSTLDAVLVRAAAQPSSPAPVLEALSVVRVELRRYPRTGLAHLAEVSLSDLLLQPPAAAPARDWVQAWRAVTIATTDTLLTLGGPQPGAGEEHRLWAVAGDLAAVASVIPALDHDLADHLAAHPAPLPLSTTEMVHLAPAQDRDVVARAVVEHNGQSWFASLERRALPDVAEAARTLHRHRWLGHGYLEPAALRVIHAVDASTPPTGYNYRPRPAAPWTADHEPQRIAPISVNAPQDLADALVWSQRMLAVDQPLTRIQHAGLAHALAVTAHHLTASVSEGEARDALIGYRDAHRAAAVYWSATDIASPGPGDDRAGHQLGDIARALTVLDLPEDIARATAAHLPALSQAITADVRSWPGLARPPRTAVARQLTGLTITLDRVADRLHRALDHVGEATTPTPSPAQPTARDLLIAQASPPARSPQARTHQREGCVPVNPPAPTTRPGR